MSESCIMVLYHGLLVHESYKDSILPREQISEKSNSFDPFAAVVSPDA